MKRRGFTLIELLIVVAIIAILALIAVPNFLEAQVRSKVSRVKEDMRSLATAIEAYHVDWTNYPTYHYTSYEYGGQVVPGIGEWFLGGTCEIGVMGTFDGNPQVTTPIVYITTVPLDVFHIPEGDDPPDTWQFMYVNWPYAFRNDTTNTTYGWVMQMYGAWRLTSAGPDRRRDDTFTISYDPSNGTVSLGQIHRTHRNPEGHAIDPW